MRLKVNHSWFKVKTYWWLPVIIIAYLASLSFIYPISLKNLGGDAVEYYMWVRDIYTMQGGFFSWTKAPGYNVYSIIYIFSYLIGWFSYKAPILFFTIINYTELILLPIAAIILVKLSGINQYKLRTWICVLLTSITIWTIICLAEGATLQVVQIQATDEYLIFVDSFIIISIAWFLNIIFSLAKNNKLPLIKLSLFIVYSLYFALTTLRFLSNAILAEMFILSIIVFRSYWLSYIKTKIKTTGQNWLKLSLNKYKICSLGAVFILLIMLFIIGYYGFFMIETYSSSTRYIMRGGELTFNQALANGVIALKQYLSTFNLNLIALILRTCYIVVFIYGIKTLINLCIPFKQSDQFTITKIFAMLSVINFILVTLAGLFSHGVVFLATNVIAHYYELSAIFSFLAIVSFIVAKLDSVKYIHIICILSLIACSIGSYIYNNSTPKPDNSILTCINKNKSQYDLHNGMGDFWLINPLMALESDYNMRFSLISDGPSLTNYNWVNNLTNNLINNNYFIYTNQENKQSTLQLISSKIPSITYKEICQDKGTGIAVFDPQTTKYIDKFRQAEFNNSLAWFYMTNYGLGQTLWAKAPWHKQFIKNHHEYFYYGSLLVRTLNSIKYQVNNDLSLHILNAPANYPVLVTDMMINASKGKFYIKANYATNEPVKLVVFDLKTNNYIYTLPLDPKNNQAMMEFNLTKATPILLIVSATVANTDMTIHSIRLGKYVD